MRSASGSSSRTACAPSALRAAYLPAMASPPSSVRVPGKRRAMERSSGGVATKGETMSGEVLVIAERSALAMRERVEEAGASVRGPFARNAALSALSEARYAIVLVDLRHAGDVAAP